MPTYGRSLTPRIMTNPEAEDPSDKDRIDIKEEVDGAKSKAEGDAAELERLPDLPLGNGADAPDARDAAAIANDDDDDDDDNDDDGSSPPRDGTRNSNAAAAAPTAAAAAGDAPTPDVDLRGWFLRHGLPYDEGVASNLGEWGVECVEQLKMLPREYFMAMFACHKFIVKETAKLAFGELRVSPVNLRRCAVGLLAPGHGAAPALLSHEKQAAGECSPEEKGQSATPTPGRGQLPAAAKDCCREKGHAPEGVSQTPDGWTSKRAKRFHSNWAHGVTLAAAVQEYLDGPPLNFRGRPMSKSEFSRRKGIPRMTFCDELKRKSPNLSRR